MDQENACRKLLHDVGDLSYAALRSFLRQHLSKTNPVTFKEVELSLQVFTTDVVMLVGNETWTFPLSDVTEDIAKVSPKFCICENHLAVDFMLIENQYFTNSMDSTIEIQALAPLETKQKETSQDLLSGLEKLLSI